MAAARPDLGARWSPYAACGSEGIAARDAVSNNEHLAICSVCPTSEEDFDPDRTSAARIRGHRRFIAVSGNAERESMPMKPRLPGYEGAHGADSSFVCIGACDVDHVGVAVVEVRRLAGPAPGIVAPRG